MNKDIRLAVSWKNHPKRMKLEKRLGVRGVVQFIDLLLSAAELRPNGHFTGWDYEDFSIAIRENVKKIPNILQVFRELRLIDFHDDGHYSVHNWENHNEYASKSKERSDQARQAARARWNSNQNHALSIDEHAPRTLQMRELPREFHCNSWHGYG